jgi:hypothetical protein
MSLQFLTGHFLLLSFFTYRLSTPAFWWYYFGDIIFYLSCQRPALPAPSPTTNSYPLPSQLNPHTALLSELCVMFPVQLSFVLNLLNVFLYCVCIWVLSCSSFHWLSLAKRLLFLQVNWTELNWTELNWTELNWTELNWTELNWTELNWTELELF